LVTADPPPGKVKLTVATVGVAVEEVIDGVPVGGPEVVKLVAVEPGPDP
jgi:hypothetical protein